MNEIIKNNILINNVNKNKITNICNDINIENYISLRLNDIYNDENEELFINEIKNNIEKIIKNNKCVKKIIIEIHNKIIQLETVLSYNKDFKKLKNKIINIIFNIINTYIENNLDKVKLMILKIRKDDYDILINIIYIYTYETNYFYDVLDKIIDMYDYKMNIEQDYKNIINIKKYYNYFDESLKDYIILKYLKKINITKYLEIIDINNVDNIYYDIIGDYTRYKLYDIDIDRHLNNNIIKLMDIKIETNEYKDIKLFVRIYNIFKILLKIIDKTENKYLDYMIEKIEKIINKDKYLLDYIINSLLIITNKLTENNINYLNDIMNIYTTCINLTENKNKFMDEFYKNIQKYDIGCENLNLLKRYLENFKCNIENTQYNNIKTLIHYLGLNIKFKNEMNEIKITNNMNIDNDMKKCNFLIIKKLKNNIKTYNIKIPNEINIYIKSLEKYYKLKLPYQKIMWIYEESYITLNYINNNINYGITGSIIPISILYIINDKKPSLNEIYENLCNNDINHDSNNDLRNNINNYLLILLNMNIIQKIDNNYKMNIINQNYNIKNIILNNNNNNNNNNNKIEKIYDYNNTIDCYIIKILKPQINGLTINEILININNVNIYFNINIEQLESRINILKKKYYIKQYDNLLFYDI
jgi:hypothetical protein